jgi:poly(3-hydroxybutyrate) depolymerase
MMRASAFFAFSALLLFGCVARATEFHRFERDGQVIEYALVLPDDFDKTKPYPVLLALPPGNQTTRIVEGQLRVFWEAEAKKRGWVVISPAAPEGAMFYSGAEKELPGLLDEIAKTVIFEGGKVHLAGPSNGGVSAYRIVTEHPERFLSLMVMPGVPPDERALGKLNQLKGIPVAAFVGENDPDWMRGSKATKQKLDALGIANTLEIVPGQSHVINVDPAKLFDILDSRRPKNAKAAGR